MLIEKFNCKNKFINYSNLKFEFKNSGIYFFQGKNGTGKTTIIESILFENNNIKFEDKAYQDYYDNDRYKLFTYIPQETIESDLKVEKYLIKNNPNINVNDIKELMEILDLDKSLLKQKFYSLSGGEKIKLSIIAGLMKKTPYVFMDEPTNFLDDKSVDSLINLIEMVSKKCILIISTHDERLLKLESTKIILDGEKATIIEKKQENEKNEVYKPKKNANLFSIIYKNHFRAVNYCILGIIAILLVVLAGYYQYSFYQYYSKDKVPQADCIQIYSVDGEYGELNRTYVENNEIKIEDSNIFNMINTKSIEEIRNISGVKDIYIKNFPKYCNISLLLFQYNYKIEYEELDFIDTFVFSVPQFIAAEDMFLNHMGLSEFLYLDKGRIPVDYKKEVSISKNLLKVYFNFNDVEVEEAIGKTIILNGESYDIVGIQTLDICLISYSEDNQYGIYKYDKSTYIEFADYLNKYMMDSNYINNNLDSIFITTEQGKEEEVLKELISKYPSNNFYSSDFVCKWKDGNNKEFILNNMMIFTMVAFLIGILLMVIQSGQLSFNLIRLKDYGVYYLAQKKVINYYLVCVVLDIVFVSCIGIIASLIINTEFNMFNETLPLLLLSSLLVMAPTMLYIFIKIKGKGKR